MSKNLHTSVMCEEAVSLLNLQSNGCYCDATYGRGGHSRVILSKLGPAGRLIGFDKDPTAIADANELAKQDDRFSFCHDSFAALYERAEEQNLLGQFDGILFDLGVSSPQLDDASRGFSFRHNGPLDMRMNPEDGISAADWLNQTEEFDIKRVLFQYGDEKYAKRIARAICERREIEPFETTWQLAELVKAAYPKKFMPVHHHPATKTFQAIRIEINQELEDLTLALQATHGLLKPGGRLVVISFHSLEDRIVKRFIRSQSTLPAIYNKLPLTHDQRPQVLMRAVGGLIKPSSTEVALNARSRSAKCRVAEKL